MKEPKVYPVPPHSGELQEFFFEILALPYAGAWRDCGDRAGLVIFAIACIQWGGGDQYPVDMGKFTVNN